MKALLVIFILNLALASTSFAESGFAVICSPSSNPNGLGIQLLVLDISEEDPDAIMFLTYSGSKKTYERNMSYEGTSSEYTFTPYSTSDGSLQVFLKKQAAGWIANVSDSRVDTFSSLTCFEKK